MGLNTFSVGKGYNLWDTLAWKKSEGGGGMIKVYKISHFIFSGYLDGACPPYTMPAKCPGVGIEELH